MVQRAMRLPKIIAAASHRSHLRVMTHEERRVVMRKYAGVGAGLVLCVPLALPAAEKDVVELPDRARKAGALPGWLRE